MQLVLVVQIRKAIPGQALRAPGCLRLPEFLCNRHMNAVRLSALRTGRIYPPPPPPHEISLLFISVSPYSRGTLSYVWATTLGEGRGLHNNELEITNREWLRMPEPDFYREDLELV